MCKKNIIYLKLIWQQIHSTKSFYEQNCSFKYFCCFIHATVTVHSLKMHIITVTKKELLHVTIISNAEKLKFIVDSVDLFSQNSLHHIREIADDNVDAQCTQTLDAFLIIDGEGIDFDIMALDLSHSFRCQAAMIGMIAGYAGTSHIGTGIKQPAFLQQTIFQIRCQLLHAQHAEMIEAGNDDLVFQMVFL